MNGKKDFFGITKITAFTLLLVLASQGHAAKLYKWVDKEGNTHFTQTPPPNDEADADSVTVKQSNVATIPVTRKGDYEYCGSKRLPGPYDDAKSILRGLANHEEDWRASLRSKEKSLNRAIKDESRYWDGQLRSRYRSSSGNYNRDRQESLVKEIESLRCALDWADKKRTGLRTQEREFASKMKATERAYQAALDAAIQSCGYKPKNYDDRNYDRDLAKWNRCMRKHDSKLGRKKDSMQDAKQMYEQLH